MFTCGKSTEDMGSRIPDAYHDVIPYDFVNDVLARV